MWAEIVALLHSRLHRLQLRNRNPRPHRKKLRLKYRQNRQKERKLHEDLKTRLSLPFCNGLYLASDGLQL